MNQASVRWIVIRSIMVGMFWWASSDGRVFAQVEHPGLPGLPPITAEPPRATPPPPAKPQPPPDESRTDQRVGPQQRDAPRAPPPAPPSTPR